MSATNSTDNYDLPLFVSTDKPTWQGDFNEAMNKIDDAIADVEAVSEGASSDVSAFGVRLTTAENNVSSLSNTVNGISGKLSNNVINITNANLVNSSVAFFGSPSSQNIYYNGTAIQFFNSFQINSATGTTVEDSVFVPLYKFSTNLFNLQTSNISQTDKHYKLSVEFMYSYTPTYNLYNTIFNAYWDGSNTVIYCGVSPNWNYPLITNLKCTTLNAGIIA